MTSSDPAYQKNAKHWAGQADDRAEDAEAWSNGTRNGTAVASGDPAYNKNGQYYRQQAAGAMNNAQMFKRQAEAYAKGTRDGTPVPSGGVGYQDNAKYYAEQAAAQAAAAVAAITADATGLPAGAEPTAVLENGVLTIGVQKGDQGNTGRNGQDGISPTVTVTKSGRVVTISVTDGSGTTTATVSDGQDGEDGEDGDMGPTGATPNLTVGTVTTGADGTQASAEITGSAENPVLNLTIPRGSDGGGVPNGGTTGQALVKNSNTDQDVKWGGYAVPTGGSANQVLAKNSGTDGDLKWATVSGGATSLGQLSDVTVPDAKKGDGIKYTGSQWIKGTPYKSYTIDDDGYGNPCIYDLDYIFSYHQEGYPIGVHDSIGIGGENPDYYVTDCKMCDDGNGNMGYVAELMRIKQNGKIEKRVFSQRYVNGDLVYSDETPTGMISNTETVTQSEYNALVSAGAIDSQTLYCIKESV